MPSDVPRANFLEARAFGAKVTLVDGLISDCAKRVAEGKEREGWFDVSTLKEPYRIEGKKTMGFEAAENFEWNVPDAIFYPTGGGVGMIGMWKAFDELEQLGWIGRKRPRMIAVQAEGCAPIVRAFERDEESSEFWQGASTVASGLRVPKALGAIVTRCLAFLPSDRYPNARSLVEELRRYLDRRAARGAPSWPRRENYPSRIMQRGR